MLALVANFNPFAAWANEVFQRSLKVQCISHLIKVGHLKIGALANAAAVGLKFTQDHFQQRCFAGAVGAQQADLVATQQGGGKVFHNHFHIAFG